MCTEKQVLDGVFKISGVHIQITNNHQIWVKKDYELEFIVFLETNKILKNILEMTYSF